MREEYAAPGTDSPPAQPSAWQLRFGKKASSRLQPQANESNSEANVRSHYESEARSPSISEQLLRALDAKPKEQEELSRDCVDELIGRRNAFATEPELRLRTLTKCPEGGDAFELDEFDHADVAAEVKEIIRARLQIETRADSLRQAPEHQQRPKRQTEARCATKPRTATPTTTNLTSRKTAGLSNTTPRCHKKKNGRTALVHSENDNQTTGLATTTAEPPRPQRQNNQEQRLSSRSRTSSKKLLPRQTPPQQQPMERRHQLLQEARKARKMKAAEDHALRKVQDFRVDNNKEEDKEQRRIQDQIERLTLENQQAAALEERLQNRRNRLKSLSNVFEGWRRYVGSRQELQTRVLAEFNWRILKSITTHWKRYTRHQLDARSAEQARLKWLREQQLSEQATHFHRSRCLPKWFYRWTSFVTHQKDQRATERVTERRRAQSERLMERLHALRQRTVAEESQPNSADQSESECALDNGEEKLPRAKKVIGPSPKVRECASSKPRFRHQTSAWTSSKEHQTNPEPAKTSEGETPPEASAHLPPSPLVPEAILTRTPKHVDKVYKAMEQRAVERKQRREELRQRYEELERKKREEQEEQRAAREALLLQQRMEEKTRIRERKLAEAIALKEKQERRDYMIAQLSKARKHNRQRLLFYYALLPWRRHHALVKRVTRNACRWHDLRTVYSHWGRWLEFVQIRRKLHRRRERAQLEVAARHHARALQRRALWSFMRYHQATEARALAVRRQNQWNTLQSSWLGWCKRLMSERAHQRKAAFEAADKLQQEKLRRICVQWRRVTCDAKQQHELEREKQQLWRKVRGWLDEGQ